MASISAPPADMGAFPLQLPEMPGFESAPLPAQEPELMASPRELSISTTPHSMAPHGPAVTTPAFPTQRTQGSRQLSSTSAFTLSYQLDNIGPSGVGMVEVFVTEDQGETWWKYGNDFDRTSPAEIEVPSDGEFGFSIRARSGSGLSAPPPEAGERPEVVVLVDQTPPQAELFPATLGEGEQFGEVTLRWSVSDRHPNAAPVSLAYAPHPNGPWEPITGWMADAGEYQWRAGLEVPPQIYLRLAARDEAGNVTYKTLRQPITIDTARPAARITGISPIHTSRN